MGSFLFCCTPVNSDRLGSGGGGGGRDPPGPKQSRNNYFGRGDNLHLRMLVPGMRTPLDGWRTHRRDELGFCRRNQSKSIQGYTNHRLYEYKRAQILGCINTPGFFKCVFSYNIPFKLVWYNVVSNSYHEIYIFFLDFLFFFRFFLNFYNYSTTSGYYSFYLMHSQIELNFNMCEKCIFSYVLTQYEGMESSTI